MYISVRYSFLERRKSCFLVIFAINPNASRYGEGGGEGVYWSPERCRGICLTPYLFEDLSTLIHFFTYNSSSKHLKFPFTNRQFLTGQLCGRLARVTTNSCNKKLRSKCRKRNKKKNFRFCGHNTFVEKIS